MTRFWNKTQDLITLFDNWLSDPEDDVQLVHWKESAHALAWTFEFSEQEQRHIDAIIDMYEGVYQRMIHTSAAPATATATANPAKEHLDQLLARKQTEQRTPEWYQQMSTIISASELGHLFGSPYARAKFVISKTLPPPPRFQSLATFSERMSAFDWGIRFEPVVKQIYEYKYGVTLKELGRLPHPTDPRCMASPDGLIYDCPKNERTGRLIEIKCPVTRVSNGTIPKEYYDQMQMQLHVTGLTHCDYVEATFSSAYKNVPLREGATLYHGTIALVRQAELKNNQEFYYVYSPVNAEDWLPMIPAEEEIVELIPWRLVHWQEQLICRSEAWWMALCPVMEAFWADVERQKQGTFVAPESTRATKKQKTEKCEIVFQRLDEDGMALT